MTHNVLRIAILAMLAGACGAPRGSNNTQTFTTTAHGDWAQATLARMSLRDKAGQMVWPTVHGIYRASDNREWLAQRDRVLRDKVGGFTIALGSPFDFAALTNQLQTMSDVPLLFAADFEFGAGYRARGGYFMPNGIDMGGATLFPQQMALGATGDSALAYAMGRVTSIESR